MNTLCRFAAMSRSKLPLSAPFPQVIFSDAQYTILPDVSAYRYPDKTVYVSTVSMISIISMVLSYRYPDCVRMYLLTLHCTHLMRHFIYLLVSLRQN